MCVSGFLNLKNIFPSLLAEDHFLCYFSRVVHHCFFPLFFNAQDVQIISTFHTWNFFSPSVRFSNKTKLQ